MNATDEAAEWFIAQRTGELSVEECEKFIRWLGDSAANVREYLAVAELWGVLPATPSVQDAAADDLRQALQSLAPVATLPSAGQSRIDRGPEVSHRTRPLRVRVSKTFTALAASILVLICAAVFLGADYFRATNITTRRGEQRSVGLADGSVMQVNALSHVGIAYDARVRRVEFHEGEALFHVAPDANRPFEVVTPDAIVRAVGTTFNVSRRGSETRVAVVDGKVQVLARTRVLALEANETVDVKGQEAIVRKAPASSQKATAWTNRRLIFEEEPLSRVAEEFNLYNERLLSVEGELAEFHINGVFDADDPYALIAYLERVQNVEVEKKNNSIRLRRSGTH